MRGLLRQLISYRVTQLAAKIIVLEHELNVLRGLRISAHREVAEEAVKREGVVEGDLRRLRETQAKQAPLFNAVDEDELPPAVGFSGQPKPDATK